MSEDQRRATELLESVYGQWSSGAAEAVLRRVEAGWDEIRARPLNAEDAETCRQAMLAASRLGRYAEAVSWRVRATSRFVATGWQEGVMAVMMTEMFRALSLHNDHYPDGRTIDVIKPSRDAMSVLDELPPFGDGDGDGSRSAGPDPAMISRFHHEKRGFLLMLERRWDEALASYTRALDFVAADPRGDVKVRAGRALVAYLADLEAGGDGREAAEETARLVHVAKGIGAKDVEKAAEANVSAMRRGSRALEPYEML